MQYNNLNLLYGLVTDILRNGNPSNFWDDNGEKGIQPVKHEFVTKKGNFSGRILRNLYNNKVIDYLMDKMSCNTNEDSDISNYIIKSHGFLTERIRLGLPIPFVLNENKECTFLVKKPRCPTILFLTFYRN